MVSTFHKKDENQHLIERKKKDRSRIDIRCTVKEKELIKKMAKAAGLDMSEFIREQLFGKRVVLRVTDSNLEEV
jgi:hypothetical protein